MSLIVYGDFTDLLSLVASLRTDALIAAGVPVEWRAVVGQPTTSVVAKPRPEADRRRITAAEVPGAPPALSPPGFVPNARAAAAAYAEAVGAGVGDHVRYLLFSSYWRDQQDIGNPDLLRRLLAVPILHGNSDADVLREYGYAVSIAGGPITSTAWRLRRGWEKARQALDHTKLPAVVDGGEVFFGAAAIRHLGTLGGESHTPASVNPYPLPPMRLAARRLDMTRPRGRPIWRDG